MFGGLLAAMCCIGPAVGAAAGVGAGSLLLAAGDARFLLFGIGALLAFGAAAVFYAGRRRTCESRAAARALRARLLDATLLAFGLTYLVGRIVIPRLIAALS
jgi:hypothetical protein